MKSSKQLIFICLLLLSSCVNNNSNSDRRCEISDINIFKEFKDKKVEFKNQEVSIICCYKDTLSSIRKIELSINSSKRKCVYIYKKNLFEKEYQDNETLILSNLESSFVFGKDKQVFSTKPIYSTTALEGKDNTKYNLSRYSGHEINFFRSGRFVDTYYISFNNLKSDKKSAFYTVRLRDIGENLILENVVVRGDI